MTLRFAAARPAALTSFVAHAQLARMATRAANDNDDSLGENHRDLLRMSLKHFARLGLAAAADARDHARQAHFVGDRARYLHWLAICRTLDRRMAVALATNLAKRGRN
jgi:hypothetical protein